MELAAGVDGVGHGKQKGALLGGLFEASDELLQSSEDVWRLEQGKVIFERKSK